MKTLNESVVLGSVLMRGIEDGAVVAKKVDEDCRGEELLSLVRMQALESEASLGLHLSDVSDDDRRLFRLGGCEERPRTTRVDIHDLENVPFVVEGSEGEWA